jgi:hypothetical protein
MDSDKQISFQLRFFPNTFGEKLNIMNLFSVNSGLLPQYTEKLNHHFVEEGMTGHGKRLR